MPRPYALVRLMPAVLCATLVLVSCAGDETADDRSPGGEANVGESPGASDGPAGSLTTREAVADLARRLDVPEDEIVVDRVEEVTWSDGSLGCAEPGMMYTQALVDGSRITLRAGDEAYEYHAGGRRAAFLCEKPTQ